jgi:hypothetical protein
MVPSAISPNEIGPEFGWGAVRHGLVILPKNVRGLGTEIQTVWRLPFDRTDMFFNFRAGQSKDVSSGMLQYIDEEYVREN